MLYLWQKQYEFQRIQSRKQNVILQQQTVQNKQAACTILYKDINQHEQQIKSIRSKLKKQSYPGRYFFLKREQQAKKCEQIHPLLQSAYEKQQNLRIDLFEIDQKIQIQQRQLLLQQQNYKYYMNINQKLKNKYQEFAKKTQIIRYNIDMEHKKIQLSQRMFQNSQKVLGRIQSELSNTFEQTDNYESQIQKQYQEYNRNIKIRNQLLGLLKIDKQGKKHKSNIKYAIIQRNK